MLKNGVNKAEMVKEIKKILITQPKPESDKSPYFELQRKYNVELEFRPFIHLEPIPAREFRKQKIEIQNYSAVVFTSRNAIDHFFRICEEMKVNISQDTKYFCITEAVALYLQKFILYRKRKVFYGADGSNKSLFDAINKHKENEKGATNNKIRATSRPRNLQKEGPEVEIRSKHTLCGIHAPTLAFESNGQPGSNKNLHCKYAW